MSRFPRKGTERPNHPQSLINPIKQGRLSDISISNPVQERQPKMKPHARIRMEKLHSATTPEVIKANAALSEIYKNILLLAYTGLTFDEIADRMGYQGDTTSLKATYKRALKTMGIKDK